MRINISIFLLLSGSYFGYYSPFTAQQLTAAGLSAGLPYAAAAGPTSAAVAAQPQPQQADARIQWEHRQQQLSRIFHRGNWRVFYKNTDNFLARKCSYFCCSISLFYGFLILPHRGLKRRPLTTCPPFFFFYFASIKIVNSC